MWAVLFVVPPEARADATIGSIEPSERVVRDEIAVGSLEDAATSAFLYVHPDEVRMEIVMRPFDLQQWVDLDLGGRDTIPVEQQSELKRRAGAFLADHLPVEIDGEPANGDLARIHFLERRPGTSRVIEPPEALDVHSAILGAVFVYPTADLPEHVALEWELFREPLDQIRAVSFDRAGSKATLLDRDEPTLEWKRPRPLPELPTLVEVVPPPSPLERLAADGAWGLLILASGVLLWSIRDMRRRAPIAILVAALTGAAFWFGGRVRVDAERGHDVVHALLHNVYRAFDHRDEARVYDTLAQSASGDLLERIDAETRRGLVLANQGGAHAKLKNVALEALEVTATWEDGFAADATWVVEGSDRHWGLAHTRRNRVRAELIVESKTGRWMLTGLDVTLQEPIESH